MSRRQTNQEESGPQRKRPTAKNTKGKQANATTGTGRARPALPPATSHPACDPHCVDVTGKAPEGVRIDPNITEGHPGYEESGDSEIIPPDRLARQ